MLVRLLSAFAFCAGSLFYGISLASAAELTKPGQVFRDCEEKAPAGNFICPEMIIVPSGEFLMGAPESELHDAWEGPQHRVTIARSFAVGKFEVTRDEYEAFVSATGHVVQGKCATLDGGRRVDRGGISFRDPGYVQSGSHPVVCVSWEDAKAFVAWLSKKTGKFYRLLTEAEWEYASRAASKSRYYFGDKDEDQCAYSNVPDETARALGPRYGGNFVKCDDANVFTAAVGSFKPNAFGLYDTLGNVWELVEDCYTNSYVGAPSDGNAVALDRCEKRVARGGSWFNESQTSFDRTSPSNNSRSFVVGLRVARTLVPIKEDLDRIAREVAASEQQRSDKVAKAEARHQQLAKLTQELQGQLAIAETAEWKAGAMFRDCDDVCPEMITVPPGEFLMGSPENEPQRFGWEGPQHKVVISKPFAVGRFEVTFAEWDACVSAGGCKNKPDDQGWGRKRHPVISVSWDDINQYTSWLSKKTNKTYRLLTEAEWEYSIRAGTSTPFFTGETITTEQANFDNTLVDGSRLGVARARTTEVGTFRPNAFKLHDMHGNVAEWVDDCYIGSYDETPIDGSANLSGDCGTRVVRGGSWFSDVRWQRSASRFRGPTDFRVKRIGFRVARTLGP